MPAAHLDVLVLAELNPDVVVACDGPPVFGQVEQLVARARMTLGSSGAITAASLVAQGMDVALCATVGADEAGELATRLLAGHGVDTSGVLVRPQVATGMTIVLTRPDGDRALMTFLGAMSELRVQDVPEHLLSRARHVHISSFYLQRGLHSGLPELLAKVRVSGGTTSLDPGWDPAADWIAVESLLPHLTYLLPNAAECQQLARRLGLSTDDPVEAARFLAARGPGIALKLGAEGAAWVTEHELVRESGRVTEIVDTTGAGDNFNAGFLAAVLAGQRPDRALARGVACGTDAVSAMGGTGHLRTPTRLHAGHDKACATEPREQEHQR